MPKPPWVPGFESRSAEAERESDAAERHGGRSLQAGERREEGATTQLEQDGENGVVQIAAEEELPPDHALTLNEAVLRALDTSDEIVVSRFLPGEAATGIDAERAAFDPVFGVGAGTRLMHQQVGSTVEAYGPGIDRLDTFGVGPGGGLTDQVEVSKRWATGTQTRLGYTTGYNRTDPTGQFLLVNPAWQSAVTLAVEQPLVRGLGPRQNELPILIARSREDRALHEVEVTVNAVLRRVHETYWQVYLAQTEVEDLERLVAEAETTAEKESKRLSLGDGSAAEAAQARESLGQLRVELTEARRRQIAASGALRRLLALPPDPERPVRVADAPAAMPLRADGDLGVRLALERRPELRAQRARLTTARLEVERQEAGLKPNVNAVAGYALSGLNDGFGESLADFSSGEYDDWSLGVAWKQPFGLRAERAAVERARLALSREQATLRALERTVEHDVRQAAVDLEYAEQALRQADERLDAARTQFEAVRTLYEAGQADLDRFVRARRSYAVALAARREGSVRYADAVTAWYAASGTLLTDRALPTMITEPPPAPPAPAYGPVLVQ